MKTLRDTVGREISKVVVGQEDTIDHLLMAISIGGHVLLEGVPGVAKTLLANATARALGFSFPRVQFTPDMLPSDLTGTMTLRGGELVFRPGPVFTNVLLADEINRTPPKTQAALLEAMQERQVTIEGEPHPLPDPFLVVATQNPIEYEGTYPLPEAQLDRFLFKVDVGYPDEEDEARDAAARARTASRRPRSTTCRQVGRAGGARRGPRARSTRPRSPTRWSATSSRSCGRRATLPSVALGASPRAAVHLLAAAKAAARLDGRDFVTPDDVARDGRPRSCATGSCLRPEAELERFRPDDAVQAALQAVPVPR